MSLSISGAVSGLDTATIIDQLVAIDQRQQSLIKSKQTAVKATSSTYGTLLTTLSDLASKAADLGKTSTWVGTKATSSAASVAVTASGMQAGTLTFSVDETARAHTLVSATTFGSTLDTVAAGSLTLTTAGGTTKTVDVGTGTLSEVVDGINGAGAGVRATAVLVGPGQYRLQLSGTTTGAASQFSVTGLSGTMNVLSQGTDAKITVGTDPLTQYSITSATNTFSGVIPGLSFTVSGKETAVTVSSTVDGSAVADQVGKLVDAANSALSTVKSNTTWDATAKKGGSLFGESATRRLTMDILSTFGSALAPGVSTSRDGTVSFDRSAFLAAFSADPAAVAAKIGASSGFTAAGGATGSASLLATTSKTQSGSYAVAVTSVSAREQWDLAVPGGATPTAGTVLTVTGGTRSVSWTVPASGTPADALASLNSALGGAGLGVSATYGGSGIQLTATSAGTGAAFTATTSAGTATRTRAGADVAGTIDGQPARGAGDVLSLDTGTGGAVGLSLKVSAAATGAVGTVTVSTGLAGTVGALVTKATASDTGYVAVAKAGRDKVDQDLQDQYDNWTTRLEARRAALVKQFTAMETALASMKSQLSSLSSALGSGG